MKGYIIEKKVAVAKRERDKVEIYFRDMPIRDMLLTLKQQFDLKLEIAPQVSGKLVVIHLYNETPGNAVEKIARGARLSLAITEKGVYRVGFDDEKTD